MKKVLIALGIGFAASVVFLWESPAVAQTGSGWIQLFDGKTIGDEWSRLGEANWHVEDGSIVADQNSKEGAAYLVSSKPYRDFELYIEFWSSDDANSGIYMRCQNPVAVTDSSCYEANIYDQRKDPSYGTGAIVRFAEVDPMPKAGGKWNTYEISARGRELIVKLNGAQTARVRNEMFAEGPFALQYAAGVIKFRKIAIRPL